MRKTHSSGCGLSAEKSGAVTEHLIRHNAGEDQSERERENDQCGRCEPRSGNTQVHRTEIVNYTVEIETVHLLDLVKMGVQLLARHAGAAVGKLSDALLESVAFEVLVSVSVCENACSDVPSDNIGAGDKKRGVSG